MSAKIDNAGAKQRRIDAQKDREQLNKKIGHAHNKKYTEPEAKILRDMGIEVPARRIDNGIRKGKKRICKKHDYTGSGMEVAWLDGRTRIIRVCKTCGKKNDFTLDPVVEEKVEEHNKKMDAIADPAQMRMDAALEQRGIGADLE